MPKQLFSIRFTSYAFEQAQNPNLHISTNFDEVQMIRNINTILEPKKMKYREGSSLAYHFDRGLLTVTGVADTFNPDAPAVTGLFFSE